MSKKVILALPVDGRPVTREQVQLVADIAGCELRCPDVSQLGFFRQPADRKLLKQWLMDNAEQADGFILSMDMLVYGGLVPSRFVEDKASDLSDYLQLLSELKDLYPEKPIYTFAATMRMSNNNINEEEKDYWSAYGKLIWRWSFFSDRYQCLAKQQDQAIALQAQTQIPQDVQDDYLSTRKRNINITYQLLSLVEKGVIDRLILPQDDTAEFGFNIAERRQLQSLVAEKNLAEQVLIYAGADEVLYSLLVHQLIALQVIKPYKLALSIHHPQLLTQMVARYEDRPVLESIANQITAAGAMLVDNSDDADAIIAVHSQGAIQGEWALAYPLEEKVANDSAWLQTLTRHSKPIALLDLAYANGADPQIIAELPISLNKLIGFAAWNTASNSIGSLVAQIGVSLQAADTAKQAQLLAIRFLDDYLYQAIYRAQLRSQVHEETQDSANILAKLKGIYITEARQWLTKHDFEQVTLKDIYLPWQRSFEIGLVTELTQVAQTGKSTPAEQVKAI